MKFDKISIIVVFALLEIFFFQNRNLYCQNQKETLFRAIISSSMFQDAKSQDIEAATKMLANELNIESSLNITYKIEVCHKQNEIIDKTKTPFVILYVSPAEFISVIKDRNIIPIFISEIDDNYGDIYYLITNKKRNKKSIKDFKNCEINIFANSDNQVPTLWLENLLEQNNLPLLNKFFKKITIDNKTNNVVLPVFFNKIDLAIVTKASFDLMCELNPKIRLDVEIIEISKPMIKAIFCSDIRLKNEKTTQDILNYMRDMHTKPYGKQILSLYQIDKLIEYKSEYLENILELY